MMLEGKVPVDLQALASLPGSSQSIKEKIVYKQLQNKQDNIQLEEKLRSKQDELKNEQ